MNACLTLGVIGHVDHGKTSLVKALSGIDTDRLKEEKERGMSIVLGFAYLDFGDGMIDLIDVPGHENFVRTMVAGATGIDAALLVIDVREGVKPQTAEHLAITELIGVQCGVIAFTKCDLATGPERAAALGRLRSLLKGSYLEFAPTVFTSAATGEGMEELKQVLKELLRQRMTPPAATQFYLPIDRSFSIAGRGTVVTGTLRLGCIRTGDEVELMPGDLRTTVRQLEFHNRSVEIAWPGQRVGVNLRHVKSQNIGRGDALSSVGLLRASMLLDVELTLLKNQKSALQDGQTVRLLFGTTDVAARVRLLTSAAIEPGRDGIAQLHVKRGVAGVAGEPFIIRSDSPSMTIGGGRFLDPAAARYRNSDPEALPRLRILARGSADEALTERLKGAGYAGIALSTLAAMLGISEAQLQGNLTDHTAAMIDDKHVLYKPFLDALGDMIGAALSKFHRQYPTRAGAPISHCRACLPHSTGENVFRLAVRRLCAAKRIEFHGGLVRNFGYDSFAALNEAERKMAMTIESSVRQGGLTPPDLEQVLRGEERRLELLHLLVERGKLLLLPAEQKGHKLAFHCDAVKDADRRMRAAFPPPVRFTVSEMRVLLGSTRKFTVPLLEYFDKAGVTRRYGDRREVVEKTEERR
jgi:selenocysteine-specific elongation factor